MICLSYERCFFIVEIFECLWLFFVVLFFVMTIKNGLESSGKTLLLSHTWDMLLGFPLFGFDSQKSFKLVFSGECVKGIFLIVDNPLFSWVKMSVICLVLTIVWRPHAKVSSCWIGNYWYPNSQFIFFAICLFFICSFDTIHVIKHLL